MWDHTWDFAELLTEIWNYKRIFYSWLRKVSTNNKDSNRFMVTKVQETGCEEIEFIVSILLLHPSGTDIIKRCDIFFNLC